MKGSAHKRRMIGLVALVALGVSAQALAGCQGTEEIVQQSEEPTEQATPTASSPCMNLPPEEFDTCVEPYLQAEAERQGKFREEFVASGRDFRTLPTNPIPFPAAKSFTLDAIIAEASLIAKGIVRTESLTPHNGVLSEIQIQQTIKGAALETVVVQQAGSVVVANDGSEHFNVLPDRPLLTPGAEYVLFVSDFDGDGSFGVLGSEGQFQIVNGIVTTPGKTDWALAVNGMPVEQFIAQIVAAVAAVAQ